MQEVLIETKGKWWQVAEIIFDVRGFAKAWLDCPRLLPIGKYGDAALARPQQPTSLHKSWGRNIGRMLWSLGLQWCNTTTSLWSVDTMSIFFKRALISHPRLAFSSYIGYAIEQRKSSVVGSTIPSQYKPLGIDQLIFNLYLETTTIRPYFHVLYSFRSLVIFPYWNSWSR